MTSIKRTVLLLDTKEGSNEIRVLTSEVSLEDYVQMLVKADKENPAFIIPKRTRAWAKLKPLMLKLKVELKLTLDDLTHMFGRSG